MKKEDLESIIQEFKDEIRKIVGPNLKRVLLFGSYDVVISEFPLTERDFKKHKTPFLLNVKREGIYV